MNDVPHWLAIEAEEDKRKLAEAARKLSLISALVADTGSRPSMTSYERYIATLQTNAHMPGMAGGGNPYNNGGQAGFFVPSFAPWWPW